MSILSFSLLDSQQLRSTLLLKMPCRALLWQILAFSSPFSYFNDLTSILFFLRHCDVSSFRFVRIMLFSWFIHLTGVLCPFCSSSFILSSLHLFSTEVLPKLVLSYSSFLTECFQLCSSPLLSFFQCAQPFQGSLVSLVCQRRNLVLPLLFLFCFPSGAILDLGTRSSRSGGVL